MNRGKQRAKVKRKKARRVERKKDEEFGTIVKRRGNLIIALD
jgi:hypothetical protein